MFKFDIKSFLVMLLLTAVLPFLSQAATPLRAQETIRTFPETGKTVRGIFLQYWNEHGGLAQQGYPITEEMSLTSTDGKEYRTQFFERAVFEHHPEYAGTENEVLLKLVGQTFYERHFKDNPPLGQAVNPTDTYAFKETGHAIGGKFRAYWEKHGGLAQQGYPMTDEFKMASTDGKEYTTQVFQRAVFELHPEYAGTENEVLLRLLGVEELAELNRPASTATSTVQPGPTETPAPSPTATPGPERFHSGLGQWYEVTTDIPNFPGAYVDAPLSNDQKLAFRKNIEYKGIPTTGAQLAWESHLEAIAKQAPVQADGSILDTTQKVSDHYKKYGQIEYYIPVAVPKEELPEERKQLKYDWLRPKKVLHKAVAGIQWYSGRYVAAEGGTYRISESTGAYFSIGAGVIIRHLSSETGPLNNSRELYVANATVALMGEALRNPDFDANAAAIESAKTGATWTPIDRDKYYTYSGPSGFTSVMLEGITR